ncbi:ketopantoate reductase family protein [Lichenibacterium ramalinae]|uniref:2-dehydropantoate 2-reductase n=1 Tax=Lichenibacterium ramalinae TaxID=2316527 RepID=A0A4Q2RD05_9HYPH|nr:2-dehydropantoate 2-reductase [Lichenibacterium ramalinae]RYB04648.1 2-dehydropantoate 2-reductase [Lichenibacterium ramalinae]
MSHAVGDAATGIGRDPILVWGAGAIGGALGAAFLRAGEAVVFVDTAADHVAAIASAGLEITGPVAPGRVRAPAVTPDGLAGTFRRCILAVKAHHTEEAVAALAPHVAEDGFVVSAQNGLNETVIAARVGPARTMGCFVNFGADTLAPGTVLYGGRGAVVLGEIDGADTPRLRELHGLFRHFDPAAIATPNIWGYLWAKLIYGGMLFATALTDASIADVLAMPEHRPTLTRLAHEVVAVARAEGVSLEGFDGFDPSAFAPEAPPERTARSFDDMVAHNRRSLKSHSGIWRDLAVRKRRTEVDAQLGPVVTIGARHGLPTPVTAAIVGRIHAIEEGRRPLALANLDGLGAP